jgi:hypothetical protein
MLLSISMLAEVINQPVLSTDIGWVRGVLIVIFILFLAAVVVGPIVRARSPRETIVRHTAEPGVREDVPH